MRECSFPRPEHGYAEPVAVFVDDPVYRAIPVDPELLDESEEIFGEIPRNKQLVSR